MVIPVVHHWIEIVTVKDDVVVQGQEIAVADVVEAVLDLDHHDRDDVPAEIVIEIVEKTKIKSEQEKWNVNMKENVVAKDCMISRRNI